MGNINYIWYILKKIFLGGWGYKSGRVDWGVMGIEYDWGILYEIFK